jgi:hypothetical protein
MNHTQFKHLTGKELRPKSVQNRLNFMAENHTFYGLHTPATAGAWARTFKKNKKTIDRGWIF